MPRATIHEGDGDPRHGSVNGYMNLRCRCRECQGAWADYQRTWINASPERLARDRERRRAKRLASPSLP